MIVHRILLTIIFLTVVAYGQMTAPKQATLNVVPQEAQSE